jgi:predicted nucleotidyltransferase
MNPLFKKLETPIYDFFKTNPDLKNCIYLTLSGSHGYGTNNDNSDIDLRGVLIEPSSTLFGLQTFEQFEERETDTVIYGLKKFVALCANGNPNTLELLGTHRRFVSIKSPQKANFSETIATCSCLSESPKAMAIMQQPNSEDFPMPFATITTQKRSKSCICATP